MGVPTTSESAACVRENSRNKGVLERRTLLEAGETDALEDALGRQRLEGVGKQPDDLS
jgi:hypothetical protein